MEMQITITDKSAISKLPLNLQKYCLAKEGEVISKMSASFGISSISKVIHSAMVNVGMNPTEGQDNVLLNISETVFQLINDRYKSITINEFKLACLNGSLEEYGKYYGINLKTVSDWLKGYNNDENKKKAMAEWNRLLGYVSIQPKTEKEKDEIIVNGCIHYFNEYRQAGVLKQILVPVDTLCSVFYDKLKEKGLLILTKERQLELYDKALIEYESSLKAKAKDRTVNFKENQIQGLLDLIKTKQNKPFVNVCKRMALLQYFDELIELEQDLTELLTKK